MGPKVYNSPNLWTHNVKGLIRHKIDAFLVVRLTNSLGQIKLFTIGVITLYSHNSLAQTPR